VLVMRLTTKEQELQEYVVQLNELKSSIAPTPGSLRSTLIDPAVNLIIQRMKKELEETKKKLEDTQNDLNAWKFTPDRYKIIFDTNYFHNKTKRSNMYVL
jgi:pre-mRNA-splicing regulator WTAP